MQPKLWTVSALAVELGMDRRTIAKKLSGLAPDNITGKKKPSKEWLMKRVFMHFTGNENAQDEKARFDKVRADKVELELEIARKEVAPIAVLEWALAKIASQINSVLDSLPLKIKKRVPNLSAREIEKIRKEIVKVQNEASETTLDFSGTEETA